VALKEYLLLACHHGYRKKFLQGGTKKCVPESNQNDFSKGGPTVGKFTFISSKERLKYFENMLLSNCL